MSGSLTRRMAIGVCVVTVAAAAAVGSWIGRELRPAAQPSGPYRVVVSIAPLKGIVEGLLSEDVLGAKPDVQVLIPPGVSEHGYEIPPSRLATLARADLIVHVGLGLEPQVERFLKQNPRPSRRVVCFADAVGIHAHHDHHHHHHEHGEECDHGEVDPHLWLDPALVEKLVGALGKGIGEDLKARGRFNSEASEQVWAAKVEAGRRAVREVDQAYQTRLKDVPRRTIVVAHDAWGHLAKRYDLKTVAIHGLMASEPTPSAIQNAIEAVRKNGLTTVFVEPQLNQAAGKRIADATGAKVAILDPLGDGDWRKMMERNLDALVAALSD